MNPSTRRFAVLMLVWGAVVATLSLSGAMHHAPPGAVQLGIAGITVALSAASFRVSWIKEAFSSIGVRRLVAMHVFRFIGAYFLWLHAQNRLPMEFAQRAGWGDIAAATGALALLLLPDGPGFRRALIVWNVFGVADLLLAVGTAGWLTVARPGSMKEILDFPLLLVPLWAVPFMLSIHVVLFRRFAGAKTSAPLARPLSAGASP
jgi:hypothetical protein